MLFFGGQLTETREGGIQSRADPEEERFGYKLGQVSSMGRSWVSPRISQEDSVAGTDFKKEQTSNRLWAKGPRRWRLRPL